MSAAGCSGGAGVAAFGLLRLLPLALAAACAAPYGMRQADEEACRARQFGGPPFPRLQRRIPQLSESAAYAIQEACTRRLLRDGERIVGYKAGLTGPGQPARFGLSAEALGVLLESARLQPTPEGVYFPPPHHYRRPMIEMEIALLLAEDVRAPLKDVAALKRATAGAAPAVELPDLGFAGEGGLPTGPELAAANVAARYFILGRTQAAEDADLDALQAELRLNGRALRSGRSADLALPPWEMGRRLLNRMLERGWELRRGQVLLIGALGGLQPARPGEYEADFGALGAVRFRIADVRKEAAPH